MTVQLAILRAASLIVPRTQRAEWLAEWNAELWYVHGRREATAFSLGAFPDAVWLRRNHEPVNARGIFQVESPLRCMIVLAVLAGASLVCAMHRMREISVLPYLLLVLMALLVLPAITSVDFGQYPANKNLLSLPGKRLMFFVTKVAVLLLIGLCAAIIMVSVGAGPIMGPGLMAGHVLAFRWAIADQRRRCPICLHALTNPVRIGQSSQTFLAWYGTELICAKGHGVLQVPEIATSSYRSQRWIYVEFGSAAGEQTGFR